MKLGKPAKVTTETGPDGEKYEIHTYAYKGDDDDEGDELLDFEDRWARASDGLRTSYMKHIIDEGYGVEVALMAVKEMDSDQVRQLLAGIEERQSKQASTLAQDGSNEQAVDDPTPENQGDDLELPACLDRRSVQKERAASS